MNWHFRTIGMGTINYRAASRRLAQEAINTGLFVSSQGCTESYIRNTNPEFWSQHRNVLGAKTPGFGWWLWKPEFILQNLLSINEGDGLLYLDAGSTIESDDDAVKEISNIMKLAETKLILASNSQPFIEKRYSSTQLLDLLNIDENDRNTNQFWAGCLFLVNCEYSRKIISDWKFLTCLDNHRYLLPPITLEAECASFVHHMHDQAILSALLKSAGIQSIDIGDRERPGAIRGVRHRFGFSYSERRRYVKLIPNILNFFSRTRLFILRRIVRDSLTRKPTTHSLNF